MVNGGVTRTDTFGWMPDLLAGADGADGFALAFDADGGAGLDRFLEFDVELAGTGEVHRNPGELRVLEAPKLAKRDHAEAVDIPAKKFEQRLVRVCRYGIMQSRCHRPSRP